MPELVTYLAELCVVLREARIKNIKETAALLQKSFSHGS